MPTPKKKLFYIKVENDMICVAPEQFVTSRNQNCWYGVRTIQEAIKHARGWCSESDTIEYKLLDLTDSGFGDSQINSGVKDISGNNIGNIRLESDDHTSSILLNFANFDKVTISVRPNDDSRSN